MGWCDFCLSQNLSYIGLESVFPCDMITVRRCIGKRKVIRFYISLSLFLWFLFILKRIKGKILFPGVNLNSTRIPLSVYAPVQVKENKMWQNEKDKMEIDDGVDKVPYIYSREWFLNSVNALSVRRRIPVFLERLVQGIGISEGWWRSTIHKGIRNSYS